MTTLLSTSEDVFRKAMLEIDFEAVAREYREQDEFVFIERFLPPSVIDELAREARSFVPDRVVRTYVPFFRKGGAVGYHDVTERAPLLHALYRSPSMRDFLSRLAGQRLELKAERDIHAASLYYYQRKGDFVRWHYDQCGCQDDQSYTANLGLVNDSQSKVIFQLWKGSRTRPMREIAITMTPGSVAFFNGSKPYHRAEPIAAGESRIVSSLTFVRDGNRAAGARRFVQRLGDALFYFGPQSLFAK